MTKRVACIGSRGLEPGQLGLCEEVGAYLAQNGFTVSTGNADGADQAFARGANFVNPRAVELHLPWASYNRDAIVDGNSVFIDGSNVQFREIAAELHGAWNMLGRGPQALHTRNVGIVKDCIQVIAWPKAGPYKGGTGMGMRTSEHFGIPVIDMSTSEGWKAIKNKLAQKAAS
jgi:hypothetical protein